MGPDILQDLFGNYVAADLHTAGASPEAMQRLLSINGHYSYANPSTGGTPELMNPSGGGIAARFEDIRGGVGSVAIHWIRRGGAADCKGSLRN